jgi:GrpB-like predicted nucleotidyltransferase (UPF0157 family)
LEHAGTVTAVSADQDPAVRIVAYDSAWPTAAETELRTIEDALGEAAVRLEHVGSTAVPGLAAKPILDLQLSVYAIERRELYVGPLERLGYLFVPAPDWPDYHFFAKPPERPRTHPDEAARYAALKRQVAARHPQDRLAYIEGKDEYVTALEERAVVWARSARARQ